MSCKRYLSYSQRFQEFIQKNLTWMGRDSIVW